MKIKYSRGNRATYYADENLIILPNRYKELEEKSLQGVKDKIEKIVYVTKKYVAYADIEMTFTSDWHQQYDRHNDKYLVIDEIKNIRRKEYFNDKFDGIGKVVKGLKHIKEAKEYVKSCDNKWNNDMLVGKFV